MIHRLSDAQKNQVRLTLKNYLKQQQDLVFAYLFGSFVEKNVFRDIDIGIYSKSAELIELGRFHAELLKEINIELDITYLNDLPMKHPAFAHQIIDRGEMLFTRDRKKETDYKRRVYLRYFDTAPLRKQMRDAFNKRLQEDKFGKRDYA